MTKLNTADRKNVNVLGEDDLARVVGGRGGHWPHHGGGGGNGGMRQRGQKGSGNRGNQDKRPVIVVFQVFLTVVNREVDRGAEV